MSKLILIADDDENDALSLRQTLEKAGVKNAIVTVSDGCGVLAYLKNDLPYTDDKKFPRPGILLLDLKMPRLGGFPVLEWIKDRPEFRTNMLIVVLTGHGELGNVRRAYELGARSFLTKPCQIEDVQNLIRTYPAYWDTQILNDPRQRYGQHGFPSTQPEI